ncbi:MAG: prephenate dehydrogenase [Candidatus Omnitrophica bacterium]|nr:prephenate dehydrogenase [Candidatus Omnitrophota bacterium]
MAIRKRRLAKFVVGVVRRKRSAIEAVGKKAVDRATLDFKEGVSGASLVILAGPVSTILDHLKTLPKYLSRGAVVIDVGSSKTNIERVARKYLKKNVFVGCHPMAGSSKRGVTSSDASPDLFLGCTCFMTRKNSIIRKFWEAIGSKVSDRLNADQHDEWVAGPSYSVHVSACALLRNRSMRKLVRLKQTADNPSFRDAARLSKCDPALWADILLSNKYSLAHIRDFEASLSDFRKALVLKNRIKLEKLISEANTISRQLTHDVD